jgi:hypothetical protein
MSCNEQVRCRETSYEDNLPDCVIGVAYEMENQDVNYVLHGRFCMLDSQMANR